MDRILITGATGFLASAFVARHGSKFTHITGLSRNKKLGGNALNSVVCSLTDFETLDLNCRNIDCVIHTAYDTNDVNANIDGLHNIIKASVNNKVKRLIHISSFVVYDSHLKGVLSEKSPYSYLSDPYSKTKQRCESLLAEAFLSTELEIIILQPTIVYGILGNWTAHAVKSLASGVLYLPNEGNFPCNAVHVDDVADAIYLSTKLDAFPTSAKILPKFLISAEKPTTWKAFYQAHRSLVKMPFTIHNLESNFEYGGNWLSEMMYKSLFSKLGFLFLLMAMPHIRKFRSKKTTGMKLQSLIEEGRALSAFVPVGMNRIYHSEEFEVDITLAKEKLGFQPKKNIELFPDEIEMFAVNQ